MAGAMFLQGGALPEEGHALERSVSTCAVYVCCLHVPEICVYPVPEILYLCRELGDTATLPHQLAKK